MRLPILAGRLRGRWWILESRGKPGRVLTGTYEPESTAVFERCVGPGAVVLDLGAHTGYYTLLSSVLAGAGGSVRAFEPSPRNFRFLRRHVRINRLQNVEVEEAAVADAAGDARFRAGSGSGTGSLSDDGGIAVRTVTIDGLCERDGVTPTFIKIDVEGAELRVLEGARGVLDRDRPTVILSTHSTELYRECLGALRTLGYGFEAIVGSDATPTAEVLCTPR